MKKGFFVFGLCFLTVTNAMAVNNYVPKKFNTITSHGDVYPYVLNNTKTNTNAKNISATTNASATAARRSVVPRSTNSGGSARVATNNTSGPARRVVRRTNTTARAATAPVRSGINPNVIIRNTNAVRTTANYTNTSSARPSSQRCFADYKECMENYCRREDTPYNRCYCSSKLAQIDAKYQNKIDSLIQQIIRMKYDANLDSDEIKDYWDKTVAGYTNDNPWVNIDNALNIEWADTESRIRGQNAFNIGHDYCVQHLRACYYMANNLRDAYKSEIARDCETYEKSLQRIQGAAESVIESYHD